MWICKNGHEMNVYKKVGIGQYNGWYSILASSLELLIWRFFRCRDHWKIILSPGSLFPKVLRGHLSLCSFHCCLPAAQTVAVSMHGTPSNSSKTSVEITQVDGAGALRQKRTFLGSTGVWRSNAIAPGMRRPTNLYRSRNPKNCQLKLRVWSALLNIEMKRV